VSTGGKRLVAVLVAVVLIGAAIGARAVIDGGDGDDGGNAGPDDGRTPTLLCAAELQAACEELAADHDLEIVTEAAGVSADELATVPDDQLRELSVDGWLTLSREAEIVRDERERAALEPVIGASSDRIARSPLIIGIWRDRAATLAPSCAGDTVTWKCIGEVAGRPWTETGGPSTWGVVKPGHADPATTGEGLLVIGQAASDDYDGRTDLSIDDYADDGFLEWFSRLENGVRSVPFDQMLAAGPALIDMVGTTEAEAGPALARASRDRRSQVALLYPASVATADVVYAPVEGAAGADDLHDLVTGDDGRAALARAGWRVDGEPRAAGVRGTPKLSDGDHLPDAGSLQALLETWREVTG
jgi:hypothetical protein